MSNLQISLAAMFGLTAAVAVSVVVLQNMGMFWMMIMGWVVVCFRGPAWEGVNPVLLGIGYATVALTLICCSAYLMEVPPFQALAPCFILPALAYIVGFFKGMESA